ncbi:hypothetical protein GQ600_13527 [Phytophthora cactorum]|nr:hypothetical protein GQ600_13527 [Phytophthora cactorum]
MGSALCPVTSGSVTSARRYTPPVLMELILLVSHAASYVHTGRCI